jgi:hypothetical protein
MMMVLVYLYHPTPQQYYLDMVVRHFLLHHHQHHSRQLPPAFPYSVAPGFAAGCAAGPGVPLNLPPPPPEPPVFPGEELLEPPPPPRYAVYVVGNAIELSTPSLPFTGCEVDPAPPDPIVTV